MHSRDEQLTDRLTDDPTKRSNAFARKSLRTRSPRGVEAKAITRVLFELAKLRRSAAAFNLTPGNESIDRSTFVIDGWKRRAQLPPNRLIFAAFPVSWNGNFMSRVRWMAIDFLRIE
jgi:hypothetical protein